MDAVYGLSLKSSPECDAIIRDYCKGARPNAKKALRQIIKQTGCALPRRYLARLIYHEAAGSISPGTVGSGSSLKRIQLLQEAYEHAADATALAPTSLSCAALRATLAINLLVEESALLNPANKPAKKGAGMSALDRKCQELRERFRGSIEACKVALEHPNPVMVEPVITMITATHTTCDPCSLLQEKILEWFKHGNWQEIAAEKRSVLTSMQQVLQSCYALLDSTQVPVNSIIKLLQHILRPYGAEQQMLASSRVGSTTPAGASPANGSALQLPTAQLHHAAIGELLRLLRPASSTAVPPLASADSDAPQHTAPIAAAAAAAVAAAGLPAPPAGVPPAGGADLAPLPLSVEKPWDTLISSTAVGAAAGGKVSATGSRGKGRGHRGRVAAAAGGGSRKKERSRREQFMDVESFWRSCTPDQRLQLLQVPLAPLLEGVKRESGSEVAEELMEGLVLLREQASTSARYWLCAACDRKFHTAADFAAHLEACHEQLVLLKQPALQQQQQVQGQAAGPADAGRVSAGMADVPPASQQPGQQQRQSPQQQQQQQMGLPGSGGLAYLTCSKCQLDVVGMYFSSIPQPNQQQQVQQHQLCLKCYRQVSASVGAATAEQAYTRIAPHASPHCPAWSESGSDFISTRDSFSSCEEGDSSDEIDVHVSQIGTQQQQQQRSGRGTVRPPPMGPAPGGEGQLTAQQQRQLAWLSAAVNKGTSQPAAAAGLLAPQQQRSGAAGAPAISVPAGMFVFGSNSSSPAVAAGAVGSSAAAAAAPNGIPASGSTLPGPSIGLDDALTPAHGAGGGSSSTADALSCELISELEAVHAARRGLLTQQQSPDAPPQQQPSSSSNGHSASASAMNDSYANGLPTLPSVDTGGGVAAAVDGSPRSSGSPAAAAAAAVGDELMQSAGDLGTPTAAGGRTWRDWLLPKKLLQWSDDHDAGAAEELLYGHMTGDNNSPSMLSPALPNHQNRPLPPPAAAVARRYSDGSAALASSSSSVAAAASQSSSSAPCSPRTPAAVNGSRLAGQLHSQQPDGGLAASTPATAESAEIDATPATSSYTRSLERKIASDAPYVTSSGAYPSREAAAAAAEYWKAPSIIETTIGSSSNALQVACVAAAGSDVLVDEIIRCMAQVYAADKDVADMTLGCLVDFVRRKLLLPVAEAGAQQQQKLGATISGSSSGNAAGAPHQHQQQQQLVAAAAMLPPAELALVQQFLASPEAAYLSPEMMYAALCCLPASDLQMSLAYVVRQHEDCMTQPAHTDSDGDSASQSAGTEEDAGCMSLFQLHNLDELSFEQLVEHIWPGELEEQQQAAAAGGKATGKASKGANAQMGASLRTKQQQQRQQVQSRGAAAPAGADGTAVGASRKQGQLSLAQEPKLLPATWWLDHFQQSGSAGDPPAAAAADTRVLRWVYGNIVSSQAEEFASAQAALRGQMDRSTALLEMYEGMANAWRRMQRVADKRRLLEQLRQNIKTQFAVVRSQEESGGHCSGQDAAAFLEALFTSLCAANSNITTGSGVSNVSAAAAAAAAGTPPAAAPEASNQQQQQIIDAAEDAESSAAVVVNALAAAAAAVADSSWPGTPARPPTAAPHEQTAAQQGQTKAAAAAALDAGIGSTAGQAINTISDNGPALAAQPAVTVDNQLQVKPSQLAPLYLCEPAVEVVRAAPALAREASQRYARALLERELSVLALIEAMLEDDILTAQQRLQGANDRLLARRTELSSAEAEHSRVTAEGPASHRKKDFLDKATKEAEHREKLADLKAKIDAAKAAIAEDEVTAAAAELAAADAQADLTRVREQARQIAARKKNLEDLNAQLSAPVPPLTAAALAAAASPGALGPTGPFGLLLPPPNITAAAGIKQSCDCCPPGHRVHSNAVPALQLPPLPTSAGSGVNASTAAAAAAAGGFSNSSAAADLGWSWRAQRLECLMYRVLWVAEAVKLFQAQYEPRTGGQQYELLVRASKWVKERCDEDDANFQTAAEDLSNLRGRVQQLACVDLTFDINEAALKYIRRKIETEATVTQERRSQQLLLELSAEEDARKKAQQQQQATAAAAAAGQQDKQQVANGSSSSTAGLGSGSTIKPAKSKKAAKQQTGKPDHHHQQQQSDQERQQQAVAARHALDIARQAREQALEAELEQRRRELEDMEAQREQELIKMAQEASLREQQSNKTAQAANQAAIKEQQALADAAAVVAAAPGGSGDITRLVSGDCSSAEDAALGGAGKIGPKQQQQQHEGRGLNNALVTHPPQRGSRQQQQQVLPTPGKGSAANATAAAAVIRTSAVVATASSTGKGHDNITAAATGKQRQQQQAHAHARASNTGPAAAGGVSGGRSSAGSGGSRRGGRGGAGHVVAAAGGLPLPPPPPASATAAAAPRPSHRQQQQAAPQPAPSLLDFGPTPAEAYAAAQAAKEQHAREVAAAAAPAAAASDKSQDHSTAGPSSSRSSPGLVSDRDTRPRLASPSTAAAARGVSTHDEVVHMPAGAAGSSSHLSRLSLSHMDEQTAPPPAAAAAAPGSSISGCGSLGQLGSSSSTSAGLGSSAAGTTALPVRSGSTPVLLASGSSSSGFDPFGSSYGPGESLLQQQQHGRPTALQLQSAGSAPLGADLAFGALNGLPQRPSLELPPAAAVGGSSSCNLRHALPPRPSTACGNIPVGSTAAAAAAAVSGGSSCLLDPGSPLMMGSSPADAPHIQSIMLLLDGDTGSSSGQQQQQLASRPSTSGSTDGSSSAAAGSGSSRGRGRSGRGRGRAAAAQHAEDSGQQPGRLSPAGSASWDAAAAAAAGPGSSSSASGGFKRSASGGPAAVVPRRSTGSGSSAELLTAAAAAARQSSGLISPPGLTAAAAGSGGLTVSGSSSTRPSSAASSTGAVDPSSIAGMQQQGPLSGFGGAAWGAGTSGDTAVSWGPASTAAAAGGSSIMHKSSAGTASGPASGTSFTLRGPPGLVGAPTAAAAAAAGTPLQMAAASPQFPNVSAASIAAAAAAAAAANAYARGAPSPITSPPGAFAAAAAAGVPTQQQLAAAAAAAAAATAAVSKARQQQQQFSDPMAAAMAFGDGGMGMYAAGHAAAAAGPGRAGMSPVSTGSAMYGGYGVNMLGLGMSNSIPGAGFPAGLSGLSGVPSSVQAAGLAGLTAANAGLWTWPQQTLPQQQAAAAMAAAMQQQQQMLVGQGGAAVPPAGIQGLWQQQGRGQQQQVARNQGPGPRPPHW